MRWKERDEKIARPKSKPKFGSRLKCLREEDHRGIFKGKETI
jgi:hypothetical protein